MELMDGKKLAEIKFSQLEKEIKKKKLSLSLAVVQAGKNRVSEVYVLTKKKALQKAGISVSVYRFPEAVKEKALKKEISLLSEGGIIVQLPLPSSLNEQEILDTIPPEKDVDMLTSFNAGKFYTGSAKIIPPVVRAVKILLEEHNISLRGKEVVLVGSGKLVGRPLSLFLEKSGSTVSILNSHTPDITFFTRRADIVISGTGEPGLITGDMLRDGAVVLDAGTSVEGEAMEGDIDRESVREKNILLSPVPGGIGPLTAYSLAYNLFLLYADSDR